MSKDIPLFIETDGVRKVVGAVEMVGNGIVNASITDPQTIENLTSTGRVMSFSLASEVAIDPVEDQLEVYKGLAIPKAVMALYPPIVPDTFLADKE